MEERKDMINVHDEEVYILYYIMPNGHVVIIGAYSMENDANRANNLALNVKPELKGEGVAGPFIEKIPFNDFFMGEDNFVDIKK